MRPRYEYRRHLPHIQKDNRPLFITFNTYKRWVLPPNARQILLECCKECDGKQFELHAVVVMPDHAHLLLSSLRQLDGWNYTLPEIMRAIKGVSAWRINHALSRSGSVWQAESFDHVLRSNDSLAEKAAYISQNPVRAGLVNDPKQYAWSWMAELPIF